MHICTIQSEPLPRFVRGTFHEGLYSIEVTVNLKKARRSGDPAGYVKHEVSRHLAGCVKKSGVPLGESMWNIIWTEPAMKLFNFPARAKV